MSNSLMEEWEMVQQKSYKKELFLKLIGGAFALWGLLSLIGLLIKHVLFYGRIGVWDRQIEVWFVAQRRGSLNTLTGYANALGGTFSVIGLVIVVFLIFRWRFGRWDESVVILTVMLGEVTVFLAVTFTVQRSRPAVVRLDKSPPTLSYPSGHTAAALALYGGVAVLLFVIYGRNWKTIMIAVILFSLPILVGISRLYRGMHFPSDVLAGALGGGLWMAFAISLLIPKGKRSEYRTDRSKVLQ